MKLIANPGAASYPRAPGSPTRSAARTLLRGSCIEEVPEHVEQKP
jgi:hypothetical protein